MCVEGRVCAHMYISCEIHIDFNVDFCQVTWSDIAGLDDVITDLKDTVILPIKKKHLFENSRLLQPPKGMVSICICLSIKKLEIIVNFCLKGMFSMKSDS